MRLLLDTHVVLWAAGVPHRRSSLVRDLIDNPANQPYFSSASIWEIAIKNPLGRGGRLPNPHTLLRGLTDHDYTELPVTSVHAATVANLPLIHRDPFDRILIAQAQVEGITLLTSDATVARYPGPIHLLGGTEAR